MLDFLCSYHHKRQQSCMTTCLHFPSLSNHMSLEFVKDPTVFWFPSNSFDLLTRKPNSSHNYCLCGSISLNAPTDACKVRSIQPISCIPSILEPPNFPGVALLTHRKRWSVSDPVWTCCAIYLYVLIYNCTDSKNEETCCHNTDRSGMFLQPAPTSILKCRGEMS